MTLARSRADGESCQATAFCSRSVLLFVCAGNDARARDPGDALQVADDIAHAGVAVFGPPGRHLQHDCRKGLRHRLDPFVGGNKRLGLLLAEDLDGGLAFEWLAAGEQDVERAAERIDVGARTSAGGVFGELGGA